MAALTVEDVVSASAEYDHVHEVRAVGPALVLVLEREAPMRLETLSSTESEFNALREECSSNRRWQALLDVYFAVKADEEGIGHTDLWLREEDHASRLQAGQRLSTLRVTEEIDR